MKSILKSIVLDDDEKRRGEKWVHFKKNWSHYFEGRDIQFDRLLELIEEYWNCYEVTPSSSTIEYTLNSQEEFDLLKYFKDVQEDQGIIFVPEVNNFCAHLLHIQKTTYSLDIQRACNTLSDEISSLNSKTIDNIQEVHDKFITKNHDIRNKVSYDLREVETLLYGSSAIEHMKELYERIKSEKKDGGTIYYDLGLRGLESLKFKRGDLIFFGGYTSHGKSIWLREVTYKLVTEYQHNTVFFSAEMDDSVVKQLFTCRHANNKERFPNTPYISYDSIKNALLTEEEEDFLFNVANPDLFGNEEYGNLLICNPSTSGWSIDDLEAKVRTIETTKMPIDTVTIDYLSLIRPKPKGRIDQEDYNEMMMRFKNFLLTYRTSGGVSKKLIGITACQMSREGLKDAIKNENRYTLGGIRLFSEIERSADIILATFMTDEMKNNNIISLQNLKYREGGVTPTQEFFIDFDKGYQISAIESRSEEECRKALMELNV